MWKKNCVCISLVHERILRAESSCFVTALSTNEWQLDAARRSRQPCPSSDLPHTGMLRNITPRTEPVFLDFPVPNYDRRSSETAALRRDSPRKAPLGSKVNLTCDPTLSTREHEKKTRSEEGTTPRPLHWQDLQKKQHASFTSSLPSVLTHEPSLTAETGLQCAPKDRVGQHAPMNTTPPTPASRKTSTPLPQPYAPVCAQRAHQPKKALARAKKASEETRNVA